MRSLRLSIYKNTNTARMRGALCVYDKYITIAFIVCLNFSCDFEARFDTCGLLYAHSTSYLSTQDRRKHKQINHLLQSV